MNMRRILHEPLLHFLLLGALLFWLYGALNRGALDAPGEIVVDRARVENLAAQFQRSWRRPQTTEEMPGLIDAWVREEVFYREGTALRLDRDDPVVRRRVGQKLAAIADAQSTAEAGEEELQAWLAAHQDEYRIEPRYELRQVFFDPARRGPRLDADVAAARAALARGSRGAHGDATMLPDSLAAAPASEVERVFGQDFARAIAVLPVGEWKGPIASGYGVHLVEIRSRQPGRVPTLAEVRVAVERDLLRARADTSGEAFYQSLRQRYAVKIESGASVSDTRANVGALARSR
jgi:PPIC-type PPIASE domain